MKTLTEFFGPHLLRALQTREELVAAGKTPEELPVALGEALKVEGEKLQRLLIALDIAEKKKDRLKRIVVLQPAEGQKAPHGAQEREGLVYLAEFFPAPGGAAPQKKSDDRDGKRDRGRRGRRGEGKGGDRKGPRRERPSGDSSVVVIRAAGEGENAKEAGAAEGKARRRRRRPRGPRPEAGDANATPLKAPAPRPASAKAGEAAAKPETSAASTAEGTSN